jgi:hypothetical protein
LTQGSSIGMISTVIPVHVDVAVNPIVCEVYNAPWWHLPVGICIALAALVGIIVPLSKDPKEMGTRERLLWTALLVGLTILELRIIVWSDQDAERKREYAQCLQLQQFQSILTDNQQKFDQTLADNQAKFDKTMGKFGTTINGIKDSIKTQTGGDSFAFVTFTPELGNVQISESPSATTFLIPLGATASDYQFFVNITSHGKYPLHGIGLRITDREETKRAMAELNEHPGGDFVKATQAGDTNYQVRYLRPQSPESPSGEVQVLGVYPFRFVDAKDLQISFVSSNGYWNEKLHLRKINRKWYQSFSVMGPTAKQAAHPFIYADAGWPEGRAIAEKDWPILKPRSHQK